MQNVYDLILFPTFKRMNPLLFWTPTGVIKHPCLRLVRKYWRRKWFSVTAACVPVIFVCIKKFSSRFEDASKWSRLWCYNTRWVGFSHYLKRRTTTEAERNEHKLLLLTSIDYQQPHRTWSMWLPFKKLETNLKNNTIQKPRHVSVSLVHHPQKVTTR